MAQSFGSDPIISLDGSRLAGEFERVLESTTVDTDLTSADSCVLVFSDSGRDVLGRLGVQFGALLEVRTSAVSEAKLEPVFAGEVYAIEYEADERGSRSVVRAYDPSYRLRQRRVTTTYKEMTDEDVVRAACADAGVQVGSVHASTTIHPLLNQFDETHWDFLARRAVVNDCSLFFEQGKVQFGPATEASSAPRVGSSDSADPLQLTVGKNLLHLRVGTTAAQQIGEVEVRGWDPVGKKQLSGRAEASARNAEVAHTPGGLGRAHGTETWVTGLLSLRTQSECDAAADAAAQAIGSTFVSAEGRAVGDPRLMAGTAVSLGITGGFDGKYTLTQSRHVFDGEGYTTEFRVSGEHDHSLFGMLAGRAESRIDGLRLAVVAEVDDRQNAARVRLEYPWLGDELTNWARVMQMGAGADRGVLWFPEAGDEVLVAFLGGDPSHPVVVGGLYNGVDTPPLGKGNGAADGKIETRCLRTRAGHTLEFDDSEGSERISLRTADDSISIALDQGTQAFLIDVDGRATVTATKTMTIEAKGDMKIHAGGELDISAGGSVKVKGATIELN